MPKQILVNGTLAAGVSRDQFRDMRFMGKRGNLGLG
jgi:hypothetical protein